MADSKDTTSFFRKVVKFVASPTTDWGELGTTPSGGRETDFAKSELKAMIERKRRNDFVRKREFDMLRKVRREGLTGEQLAALDGSSRIDDSEDRNDGSAKPSEVKAKIDEIEQQMVGEGLSGLPRRNSSFYTAPTQPARFDTVPAALVKNLPVLGTRASDLPPSARTPVAPVVPPGPKGKGELALAPVKNDIARTPAGLDFVPPEPPKVNSASGSPAGAATAPVAKSAPAVAAPVAPLAAPRAAVPMVGSSPSGFDASLAVEVNEIAHDPELDEAVIAFANADFGLCEQSLLTMTGPHGVRTQHAETWLTLFDLYRAIGEHAKFESLAIDYAGQFGRSSPQWFSMPKMVAEAAASEDLSAPRRHAPVEPGTLGWVCPPHLDEEAVAELRSLALQMALPWVFDWADVNTIQPQACADLSDLFRSWIDQRLDMRWLGGESLFRVLTESAPTGNRDVDPVFWKLRFDALRMANRPDQFDEVAIDYCVTYEVSPPSWEPAKCEVRVSSGEEHSTSSHPLSAVSEISTTFVESQIVEETGLVEMASLELGGQLVGDIGDTLQRLDLQLLTAPIVSVSCAKLIRVDFIAAGDLLNWVLTKRSENRAVLFNDTHRLIALFFGAMGINEHARVRVRTV